MKKLLALLGSMSILASSVTVVGFEYANLVKSSIEAKIRNYVNISSLLARATILSQKSKTDKGEVTDGKDFSLAYASRYLYKKPMETFFNQSQFKEGKKNVLSYFGAMFNFGSSLSSTYTVKNNPNFEIGSPSLHLQDGVETGIKGEDSTLDILTLLGSFLPVLLDNDFSASSSGPLLENLMSIGESPIKDLMNDGSTFQMIQDLLFSQDTSLFAKISESLSENDLADQNLDELTFDEVFKIRQVGFWQGLAEILFSGTHAEDTDEEIKDWMQSIKDAEEGHYAEKAIPAETDSPEINVQFNKILLDGITRILPYLRTLFNYIQSFSETALPITEIQDYNHLFSQTDINGIFIANQLKNKKYLNPDHVIEDTKPTAEIVQWVKDPTGQYHQVLNFQDIVQFLQQLFSVDLKSDSYGYRQERILAILFELPLKSVDPVPESRDESVSTPVFDLILEPLLQQLVTKLVPNFGGIIANFLPNFTPSIRAVLTHNQPVWQNVAGAPEGYPNLLKVLELVQTLLNFSPDLKPYSEALKEINGQIKAEQEKVEAGELPVEDQIYGQPFKTLFNGDLLALIFEALNKFVEGEDNQPLINDLIKKVCKNLATLLTTKLGDVLEAFGLDIMTLPIFLYGIKDLSLTDIINSFADWFQTNLDKRLKENQDFLFNLDVLVRIMKALTLDVKVEIEGDIPEPIKDLDLNQVNIVNAILISFAYKDQLNELIINPSGEKWSDHSKISPYGFLLGIRQDQGHSAFYFSEGSVFLALSQIYGHDNTVEPKEFQSKNKETLKIVLRGFSQLTTWFNTISVPLFVRQTFDPYFDSKNWTTELIKSKNLDDLTTMATIDYFLKYKNPDTKQTHTYEVKLSRNPASGNDDEWVEMGAWQIVSINLKK